MPAAVYCPKYLRMKLCVCEWLNRRRGPLKIFHLQRERNVKLERGGPRNIYWPGRSLYEGEGGIILRAPGRARRGEGGEADRAIM